MVETQLRGRGIRDQRLLNAMAGIPRHEFVEARYRDQAYEDHPLPIDAGQTISQPYIVALMLELLQLDSSSKVLEIGTGSGYQAAVLSRLAGHVYTVERHPELARQAADTLSRLGLTNVSVVTGDGSRGLAEHAPFDAIVVAAAAAQNPPALFEQLREGGRMIIPVGPPEAARVAIGAQTGGRGADQSARRVPLCAFDQRCGPLLNSTSKSRSKAADKLAAERSRGECPHHMGVVLYNSLVPLLRNLRVTLEMIKWEHSIFALPFALCGAMLAANGLARGTAVAVDHRCHGLGAIRCHGFQPAGRRFD